MLFAISAHAQKIEWKNEFQQSDYDRVQAVCQATDGTFLIAGQTYSEKNGTDILVQQVDVRGGAGWTKVLGDAGKESANAIVACPDSTFVIAGKTSSKGSGGRDWWVVKIDHAGRIIWDQCFGGRYDDEALALCQSEDNGFVICGTHMVKASSTINAMVVKIDRDGNRQWSTDIEGHFRNYANAVCSTDDGYVVGITMHPGSGDDYKSDMGRIVKLDKKGNIVWEKICGGEKDDALSAMITVDDGAVILCGSTSSIGKGQKDVWLLQLDRKGKMVAQETWGDIRSDEGFSMCRRADGTIVIGAGTANRASGGEDAVVLQYNTLSDNPQSMIIAGEINEKAKAVCATDDGGFITATTACTPYLYDNNPVKCHIILCKYSGDPLLCVNQYMTHKMSSWQIKGEFEKTADYEKRVRPENLSKVKTKHRKEAIAYYAAPYFDLEKSKLGKYDADHSFFRMNLNGVGPVHLNIPLDEAEAFKAAFLSGKPRFEKPVYDLQNGQFVLKSVDMIVNGGVYSYVDSAGTGSFHLTGKAETPETLQYRGGGDPLQGLNVAKSKELNETGKYYALIIGVDNYKGQWPALSNAVHDAQSVELLLKQNYRFDHFKTLYDEQATRQNIIDALYWLVQHVTPNDNVLIYYSGHGQYDKKLQKGYWVPVDAQTASISMFISNSDLQTLFNGIHSKHTLLVADACFSGDIFRGNTIKVPFEESEKYYREVGKLASRQALTAGGVEPVMDGGREGHSVFAYYFLKALRSNEKSFLDAGQLYQSIKIPVVNNSTQTPNLQPIRNTGDEGGQFIFIKK